MVVSVVLLAGFTTQFQLNFNSASDSQSRKLSIDHSASASLPRRLKKGGPDPAKAAADKAAKDKAAKDKAAKDKAEKDAKAAKDKAAKDAKAAADLAKKNAGGAGKIKAADKKIAPPSKQITVTPVVVEEKPKEEAAVNTELQVPVVEEVQPVVEGGPVGEIVSEEKPQEQAEQPVE